MISDVTWKLAMLRIRLSEFEFQVVHRAGIKHLAEGTLPNYKQ